MSLMTVLSFSFALLVAVLYSVLVVGTSYARVKASHPDRGPIRVLRLCVGGFLLITGWLAMTGFFANFDARPPRIFFPIAIAFIGMLYLAFHKGSRYWIEQVPQSWLIGLQSFRILVEIQLYYLAMTPFLPQLMTFEGRNFDVITGVTALILGLWLRRLENSAPQKAPGFTKGLIIAWNVTGLGLLTNVVVHGLLSAPTPLRMIIAEPPNTAIAQMPFIWLPTFVVPFAYLLHILSIRKVLFSRT